MKKKKLTKIIDEIGKCFIHITMGIFYALVISAALGGFCISLALYAIYAKENGISMQNILNVVKIFSNIARIGIGSLFIGLALIAANHYNDFKRKNNEQ